MSKSPLGLSSPRDIGCGVKATPASHQRETGSFYKKSFHRALPNQSNSADFSRETITGEVEVVLAGNRAPPRTAERFLKGPIPLSYLAAAARIPGKALALFIIIKHRCDLERCATVTLPLELLRSFGIDRDSKSRALRALELAGLVRVAREKGRGARVTLEHYS
jgi:hypothetical protein